MNPKIAFMARVLLTLGGRAGDDVVDSERPPGCEARDHCGRRPGPSRGDELHGASRHLSRTRLAGVIGERQGSPPGTEPTHTVENPGSGRERKGPRRVATKRPSALIAAPLLLPFP